MGDLDRYYKILDLKPGASLEEIKQAYRDRAHAWHTDRFVGNPRRQSGASANLKDINEAYAKLRSISPRAEPRSTARPRSTQNQKQQSARSTPPPVEPNPENAVVTVVGVLIFIAAIVGSVAYYADTQTSQRTIVNEPSEQETITTTPSDQAQEQPNQVFEAPTAIRREEADELSEPNKPAEEVAQGETSAPGRPDLTRLSSQERESIESACLSAKVREGPASYNTCLQNHLASLSSAPRRPDLTRLSTQERQSIESACLTAKVREGPAAYNTCHSQQFQLLRPEPPKN